MKRLFLFLIVLFLLTSYSEAKPKAPKRYGWNEKELFPLYGNVEFVNIIYFYVDEYRFDENGNVIEYFTTDLRGNPVSDLSLNSKYSYKYDKCGYCIEKTTYFENNKVHCIYTYKYDEKGNCIEEINHNENREPIGKEIYKYDENNCYIEELSYFSDGSLFCKYNYKYDKQGNCIERARYGSDMRLNDNLDGIAKWKYKYDNNNNKIEEIQYNSNNELVYKCVCKYNKKGLKIEKAEYSPVENLNWVITYKYKYDRKGNIIESAEYQEGNIIPESIIMYEIIYRK